MKYVSARDIDVNKLNSLGIYELRNLGRALGVPRPTTFQRDKLIAEITKQIQGNASPQGRSNRGRPPREFNLDVSRIIDIEMQATHIVELPDDSAYGVKSTTAMLNETRHVSGYFHLLPVGHGMLIGGDFNTYYIPAKTVALFNLSMGDYIDAKAVYSDERKNFVTEQISQINGQSAQAYAEAPTARFDQLECLRPNRILSHNGKDFKAGQRVLISTSKDFARVEDIAASKDLNAYKIALVIEESEDCIDFLVGNGINEVYLAKVNMSIKKQLMLCLTTIFAAKKHAEQGKDVIVYIDSFTKLFKLYNNSACTDGQINVNQVNLISLVDLKTFFLSAKELKRGGSLSIIAYISEPKSELEKYIFNEFADIASLII